MSLAENETARYCDGELFFGFTKTMIHDAGNLLMD